MKRNLLDRKRDLDEAKTFGAAPWRNVRYWGKSRPRFRAAGGLLLAKRRHSRVPFRAFSSPGSPQRAWPGSPWRGLPNRRRRGGSLRAAAMVIQLLPRSWNARSRSGGKHRQSGIWGCMRRARTPTSVSSGLPSEDTRSWTPGKC